MGEPRVTGRRRLVATLAAAVALASPADAAAAGALEPFGLEARVVTSLGIHGSLYAGTLGDGVFRRDPAGASGAWTPLGLEGKRIRAVYPHAQGPLGIAVTVGVENDTFSADSALIYCSCMDQGWVVADSGLARADVSVVWALDGFPSPAICGETFAGTFGSAAGVWRRLFNSTSWTFALDDIGFGVCNVVRANPANGDVWAGGENAIMAPWIARSTDRGETWQIAFPDLAGDNACNSLVVHPDDPLTAYAGMEGPLIRTTDGGATWHPTGLSSTPAYLYGLALDSGSPSHLLAGGMVRNPNNWALWESFDGGVTWVERAAPAPGTTGISSIVADPARAGTFYIATLGDGVWRYRHAAAGVGEPGPIRPAFGRVYPNPFRATTTIEIVVPADLSGAALVLAVYDLRGSLVRELASGVATAGTRRIEWDGTDAGGRLVAPGVYHARLRAGPGLATVKLALLR
jgi:hypothetical protein